VAPFIVNSDVTWSCRPAEERERCKCVLANKYMYGPQRKEEERRKKNPSAQTSYFFQQRTPDADNSS